MTTAALGELGERLASDFLQRAGLRIVDRNYRTNWGEIDIVCRDDSTLVFVEVKTRSSAEVAQPHESVGHRKRSKLRLLAEHYIATHNCDDVEVRFDVISIVLGEKPTIEHIVGAF